MEDDTVNGCQFGAAKLESVGLTPSNIAAQYDGLQKVTEETSPTSHQNTTTCIVTTGSAVYDQQQAHNSVQEAVIEETQFSQPQINYSFHNNIASINETQDLEKGICYSQIIPQQSTENTVQHVEHSNQMQNEMYELSSDAGCTVNGSPEMMGGILESTYSQPYQSAVTESLGYSETLVSSQGTSDYGEAMSMNHMSVMQPTSLSDMFSVNSGSQLSDMRSFNSTPSDFAFPAGSVLASYENQNSHLDSEQSQDSSSYARPQVSLNLSHLLQAAAASPFSDQIESPMSSMDAQDMVDSRSQQGTPDPDQMYDNSRHPRSGPRRKKTWLIEEEEDPDKPPLNSEQRHGLRILKEIMSDINKSLNWPFMNAVDERDVPDYYDRIESPMWLRKMREKFDNREYNTITEFVADFRLMLENCYRFNGPDHQVSRRGQRLETVLEQKLALLSRELREKTSIAATSGKPQSERQLFSGSRRRKALVPHDSTALLNQLRLEQQEKVKEHRKMQVQERKTAHEQFVKELDDWEDSLFIGQPELRRQLMSMWEIPQIGHFLYLCLCPYDLGEVTQWELERSFLVPRESTTMQRVMTSLLSTPYQRTQLNKKPPMPYKVWDEKLRKKLHSWYQMLRGAQGDVSKVCAKLGLEEKFFKVVGLSNPMSRRKYHELSVYQRVWIMKGLCDYCLEHQENLREAIEAVQPPEDQNCYPCGTDADGYTYVHFPQFCGADVRLYRQAPFKYPKLDIPPLDTTKSRPRKVGRGGGKGPSPKKKQKKIDKPAASAAASTAASAAASAEVISEASTPRSRDRRLRQNPRQAALADPMSTPNTSDFESGQEDSEDTADSEEEEESGAEELVHKPPRGRARRADCGASSSRESTPSVTRSGRQTGRKSRDTTPSASRSATPTKLTRKGLLRGLDSAGSRSATPTKLTRAMLKRAEDIGVDLREDMYEPMEETKRARKESEGSRKGSEMGKDVEEEGEKEEEKKQLEEEDETCDTKDKIEKLPQPPDVVNGDEDLDENDTVTDNPFESYKQVQNEKGSEKTMENDSEGQSNEAENTEIKTEPETADGNVEKECAEEKDSEGDKCDGENVDDVSDIKEEVMEDGSCVKDVKEEPKDIDDTHNEESDKVKEEMDTEAIKMEENIKEEAAEKDTVTQEDTQSVKEEVEEIEMVPEILGPDLDEFELVADCVETLRDLAKRFEEPEAMYGKKQRGMKPSPQKKNEKELHDRLLFLIKELEPWEQKLQAAYKKMRIKLRKEHEAYVEPEETEDIWESEESSSEKSDDEEGDNDESEEETKQVKKEMVKMDFDHEPKLSDLLIPGVSTRSGRIRKRPAMYGRDPVPAKKQTPEKDLVSTSADASVSSGAQPTSAASKSTHQILSLKNPLVVKGPDGKTQVIPNLDPNHPALKNATLFAQLPNGATVAVSLANVMGGSNQQQQQVMRALLSAGKLSIATSAQAQVVMQQKVGQQQNVGQQQQQTLKLGQPQQHVKVGQPQQQKVTAQQVQLVQQQNGPNNVGGQTVLKHLVQKQRLQQQQPQQQPDLKIVPKAQPQQLQPIPQKILVQPPKLQQTPQQQIVIQQQGQKQQQQVLIGSSQQQQGQKPQQQVLIGSTQQQQGQKPQQQVLIGSTQQQQGQKPQQQVLIGGTQQQQGQQQQGQKPQQQILIGSSQQQQVQQQQGQKQQQQIVIGNSQQQQGQKQQQQIVIGSGQQPVVHQSPQKVQHLKTVQIQQQPAQQLALAGKSVQIVQPASLDAKTARIVGPNILRLVSPKITVETSRQPAQVIPRGLNLVRPTVPISTAPHTPLKSETVVKVESVEAEMKDNPENSIDSESSKSSSDSSVQNAIAEVKSVSQSPSDSGVVSPQSEYFHYNSLDKLPPHVIHRLLKTQPQRLKGIQTGEISPESISAKANAKGADSDDGSQHSATSPVNTAILSPSKTPKYATNVTVKALLESRAAASGKEIVPPEPGRRVRPPKLTTLAPRIVSTSASPPTIQQGLVTSTRTIAPRPQGIMVPNATLQLIRSPWSTQQFQFVAPQVKEEEQTGQGQQVQGQQVQGQQVQGQQVQGQQVQGQQVQGQLVQEQSPQAQEQSQTHVINIKGQPLMASISQLPIVHSVESTLKTEPVQSATTESFVAPVRVLHSRNEQYVDSENITTVKSSLSNAPVMSVKEETQDHLLPSSQLQAAMALQQLSQTSSSASLDHLQAGEALAQLASQPFAPSHLNIRSSINQTVTTNSAVLMKSPPPSPLSDDLPRIAVSVIGTDTVHQVPQSAATVLKVTSRSPGGKPVAVNAAHLKALIAKKQEAIDKAVKTVITEIPTTLPTAQIKVSSPFTNMNRLQHRPVTITAPSCKAPIVTVPKLEVGKKNFDKSTPNTASLPSTSAVGTTMPAAPVSSRPKILSSPAAGSQKNLVLKVTPTSIQTPQGLVQGIVIPPGVNLPPHVLQQLIGQKGENMVVLQQGKDNNLQIIHSPPGLNLKIAPAATPNTPQPSAASHVKSPAAAAVASSSPISSAVAAPATMPTSIPAATVKVLPPPPPSALASIAAPTMASTTLNPVQTISKPPQQQHLPQKLSSVNSNPVAVTKLKPQELVSLPQNVVLGSLPRHNIADSAFITKAAVNTVPQNVVRQLTTGTSLNVSSSEMVKLVSASKVTRQEAAVGLPSPLKVTHTLGAQKLGIVSSPVTVTQLASIGSSTQVSAATSASRTVKGNLRIAPSPVKDASAVSSAAMVVQPKTVQQPQQQQQQQQRLVLYNVNGQLVTQQGVAVTLSGGVLRPVTPTSAAIAGASSATATISSQQLIRQPSPVVRQVVAANPQKSNVKAVPVSSLQQQQHGMAPTSMTKLVTAAGSDKPLQIAVPGISQPDQYKSQPLKQEIQVAGVKAQTVASVKSVGAQIVQGAVASSKPVAVSSIPGVRLAAASVSGAAVSGGQFQVMLPAGALRLQAPGQAASGGIVLQGAPTSSQATQPRLLLQAAGANQGVQVVQGGVQQPGMLIQGTSQQQGMLIQGGAQQQGVVFQGSTPQQQQQQQGMVIQQHPAGMVLQGGSQQNLMLSGQQQGLVLQAAGHQGGLVLQGGVGQGLVQLPGGLVALQGIHQPQLLLQQQQAQPQATSSKQ